MAFIEQAILLNEQVAGQIGIQLGEQVLVMRAHPEEVAASHALGTLLARADADPVDRAGWAWAQLGVEARARPVTVAPERLQALAGSYGGRTILFEDGALFWRRASGQKARLTPMTADGLFAVEGSDDRIRMRLTGDALEMHRVDEPAPSHFPRD